ncbi:periplasmic heavy metal sensor [Sphingomonas sp. RT2P30]|uniref:periplasmic heavy metal sensor n=1 Tax=Parasphingomonas halimpatiens TaxID=3096162 RepID=UPI002FCA7674
MTTRIRVLGIVGAAFLAAILGVVVGGELVAHRPMPDTELHHVLHNRLDLDEGQKVRLDALERRFAVRRKAIELELRADNAMLAEAIETEHGYGPKVAAAVDRSHEVMGRLQKETLAHVFSMRQLLRPDQAATFDRAVTKALTDEGR